MNRIKKSIFGRLAYGTAVVVLSFCASFLFLPSTVRASDTLPAKWQYMDTWLKRDDIVDPEQYQAVVSTTGGIYSETRKNPDQQTEEVFEEQKKNNSVSMLYWAPSGPYYGEAEGNFAVTYELYYYGSWLKDGKEGATITLQLPVPVNCDPDSAELMRVDTANGEIYSDSAPNYNLSEIPFSKSETFVTVTTPYYDDWNKEADNKWDCCGLNVYVVVVFNRQSEDETTEAPETTKEDDAAAVVPETTGGENTPKASELSATLPRDAVSPENPAKASEVKKTITKVKNDKDPKGSTFFLLQAKGVAKSRTSIKLTWKKVKGAKKYIIYGNKCGKKNKYKKIKVVTGKSFTQKKLKKGTYYKYLVVAVNGEKALATSKTVHVATKGGKVGNPAGVKLSKKKLSLKTGKSKTIKATLKKGSGKVKTHRKIGWESDNILVAKVSSKGKITAVGKGTCSVYVYAQNGVFAKIKVTVK